MFTLPSVIGSPFSSVTFTLTVMFPTVAFSNVATTLAVSFLTVNVCSTFTML